MKVSTVLLFLIRSSLLLHTPFKFNDLLVYYSKFNVLVISASTESYCRVLKSFELSMLGELATIDRQLPAFKGKAVGIGRV